MSRRRKGVDLEALLLEFIKTPASESGFEAFLKRWEGELCWHGSSVLFRETQDKLRSLWEGKNRGSEGAVLAEELGLAGDQSNQRCSFKVDWRSGSIQLIPTSLNDLLWQATLTNSQRLAVCDHKGCASRFFLKTRKNQSCCTPSCDREKRKEYMRDWWNKHGEEWRADRLKRSRKGS